MQFIPQTNIQVYDDYYTPKIMWEKINHLLPKDKIIWEAFLLNSHKSTSKKSLEELGNNMVGETDIDFLKDEPPFEYDMICSNPPFNKVIKIPILQKLVSNDKPFILIMNSCNLFANYFFDAFADNLNDLQIIHPKGKLYFEKLLDDGTTKLMKNTSFYSIFVCYKMNIPNKDLWVL